MDDTTGGTSGRTDVTQWRDALPAELKADPGIKDFKDPADLVKSFINLQKMLGNSIRPPGPDASAEDVKKFQDDLKSKVPGVLLKTDTDAMWDALGRPKTAEAYTVPENVKLPDEEVMAVRKYALENGMTVEQAKGLFKTRATTREDALSKQALWNEELHKEWGNATEERKALAIVNAEKFGAPKQLIEEARAGKATPETWKFLYSVVKAVGPGEGNGNATSPGTQRAPEMTPNEAEAQIAELQKNPAWRNENDPRHQSMILKMVELVEIANAGKSVGDGVGHILSMTGVVPGPR